MRDFTRRDFLKTMSATTLATLAAGRPRPLLAGVADAPKARADTLIILYMAGGMAHTETFDPKTYSPFVPGMKAQDVISTFPAIDTAVDGIRFTQGLEETAGVMDRGTLIRTYRAGDMGKILHTRHLYHWHTGYIPPQTVAAPHIGAVVARTLGPRDPAMPAFINIGQRFDVGEGEELKAYHTAGFLGSEHGPFNIPLPAQAMQAIRPPEGMTPDRFASRNRFYRQLVEQTPVGQLGSDYQKESLIRSMDNAHRLLSSKAAQAFDLSREPAEVIQRYDTTLGAKPGNWAVSRFGLGCLLARRLVEAGARFIEVSSEYVPFQYFDTHESGHSRMAELKRQIDAPIAQLVLDLEERGLLDRTLIVLASEFSRDMLVEGKPDKKVPDQVKVPDVVQDPKHYGMHRHFTDAGCVLMFGGGIKRGHLHGKTADERPFKSITEPVVIEDLHATIYTAMGISPQLAYEVEKRPFYVTRDGLGKPIESLFA